MKITPHESYPDLAAQIGVEKLYLKREDLHPLGSHKGRSIPIMIDMAIAEGMRDFAISSSGNAALAAGLYVKQLNETGASIALDILIGQKIPARKRAKLDALKDENIRVSMHERPLQALFGKTQNANIHALRQSNNDTALIGYESLAEELSAIPDLKAVFIGTSSGTTAQALAAYFLKSKRAPIEVHIVQTPTCHPIADAFNEETLALGDAQSSIADAIVDHTALRRNKLIPLIEKTDGSGWIATNDSINTAQTLVKKYADLSISPNSALSVAGLMNAVYAGRAWNGSVACLICGE